jgi:hypothetical protein
MKKLFGCDILKHPLPGRKSKNDNDICAKHREMQFEDLQNCQRRKVDD